MSEAKSAKPQAAQEKRRPRWRRWVWRVLVVGVVWVVAHLAVLTWIGLDDDLRPADVAVVLGNYVAPDGSVGDVVKGRLDRALELYRAGTVKHIIVSGARAPGGYDEPTGMKAYLVSQGVPAEAITLDQGGTNTYLTALNTRRLMKERGWQTVTIVSQYYHILRARAAFRRMGIADARSAHASEGRNLREPYSLLREFVGLYWYLIRGYPS
jgi:vancomycin permeability regulator SanA